MTNREKVQAVLKGGGKFTVSELAAITNVPVREVPEIVYEIPGIAFKDFEYYIPQDNMAWFVAIGSLLTSFIIYVYATL